MSLALPLFSTTQRPLKQSTTLGFINKLNNDILVYRYNKKISSSPQLPLSVNSNMNKVVYLDPKKYFYED